MISLNKKRNVGFISFGTGGTMGHMSLITHLAKNLSDEGFHCTIFSEYDYETCSNVSSLSMDYIKLPPQEHTLTVGGCLKYNHVDEALKLIKESEIDVLVFSTLFDKNLVESAKKEGIKVILISYPLRDSHREAFYIRGYDKIFSGIYTLKDLFELDSNSLFLNEKVILPFKVNDFSSKEMRDECTKNVKILITCGGGGRPSSLKFLDIVSRAIEVINKSLPEVSFTIIEGNSNLTINPPNSKIISWSTNFEKLIEEHDFVICEAGYFTLFEIMSFGKTAIVIPGARRIDNQELRAITYDKLKYGYCFFPEEEISNLVEKIKLLSLDVGLRRKLAEKSKRDMRKNLVNYSQLSEEVIRDLK